MPRKPTLSPSRLTTYLACPLKYRWTYVDPRGRWYLRAKHYYSFGTTLHRVLQRFHDSGDSGVETLQQAIQAVESEWIAEGYATPEQEATAQIEGKQIVERYVSRALEAPAEAHTLYLERMLRADLGQFYLLGRVDRVDEWPDGAIEVIDYKSGRSSVSPEDVATDIAMCCYQLLLKRMYPDRPIRATIVALRTGQAASSSLSDAELAQFESDLCALGEQILGTDWSEVVPTLKGICEDCDFVPLCRSWPEFDEAFQSRIRAQEHGLD